MGSLTKSSLKIDLEWPVIRLTKVAITAANNSIITRGGCKTTSISRMVETSKKVRRIESTRIKQQLRTTRRTDMSNKRIDGKTKGRASRSSSGTRMTSLTEVTTSSSSRTSRLRTREDSINSMARIKTTSKEEITLKALIKVAIKIRWAAMIKMMVVIKTAITIALQGSISISNTTALTTHSNTTEEATKRQWEEWTTTTAIMTGHTISMITKIIRKMIRASHSKINSSGTQITTISSSTKAQQLSSLTLIMPQRLPPLCQKVKINSAAVDKVTNWAIRSLRSSSDQCRHSSLPQLRPQSSTPSSSNSTSMILS